MRLVLFACAVMVASATLASAADVPKVTTTTIISSDTTVTGQKIVVPDNPVVVASLSTLPPGARLPVHKHPYAHYGYMLAGELTVTNDETGKSFTIKKGGFLIEMNDTWHHGQNDGKVPVKILIIDQIPKGIRSNVVLKGAK